MDVKCPIITQNGEWRYQIGDGYLSLREVLSQFPNYNDPSKIQSVVDAINNTSFTGELTDEERGIYGTRVKEQLLVANCKLLYQKMNEYVDTTMPSNFSVVSLNQKYSLGFKAIDELYKNVFGRYQTETGLHGITVNGVIDTDNSPSVSYTLYSYISLDNPKPDLHRMIEDLTMGFYKTRGGIDYDKTEIFVNHLKDIPDIDVSKEAISSSFDSPTEPAGKYVVTLSNELDTRSCDILGNIVATFLSYVEHVREGFSINPNRISSDADYYSNVFASTDLEMLSAISADMKDYSSYDHKRISTAAKEIYPVVDKVKDYLFKKVEKNAVCDDISRLNDLVKQGKIHIEPIKSSERE